MEAPKNSPDSLPVSPIWRETMDWPDKEFIHSETREELAKLKEECIDYKKDREISENKNSIEKDFMLLEHYEKKQYYSLALWKLELMRFDNSKNEDIIKKIGKEYARIQELYEKQSQKNKEEQLTKLTNELQKQEEFLSSTEKELEELQQKWSQKNKNLKEIFENKLANLKEIITNTNKKIFTIKMYIEQVDHNWYNAKLYDLWMNIVWVYDIKFDYDIDLNIHPNSEDIKIENERERKFKENFSNTTENINFNKIKTTQISEIN